MRKTSLFTAVEIVNRRRREIFLGLTRKPVFSLPRCLSRRRPEALRDWTVDELKRIRSLEFELMPGAAKDFLARHARARPPRGWRVVTAAKAL